MSVTEPGQLMVRVNGALAPGTVVGRATGTTQIVGISILTLSAGDVIEVINPPGNPVALTITPIAGGTHSVSAHLVIKRLQ
ncbi:MAG: hypothetical protein ACHQM6_00395 [Candidatus Kapaibacterium sp.]